MTLPHEPVGGWQDAPMRRGRGREPRRTATRRPVRSLVSGGPASAAVSGQAAAGAAGDVNGPPDPVRAATVSVLAGTAQARSPLVRCGLFEAVEAGPPDAAGERQRLEGLGAGAG